MKTLTGHLTAHNKKVVKIMIEQNCHSGRVNNTNYYLDKKDNIYTVKIQKMDRGLIPCPGSKLRLSTYTSTFI